MAFSSQYSILGQRYNGTVRPASTFNPDQDSAALKKAMKGIGCDEAAIADIIGHRNNAQRQEIKNQYRAAHGKELISDLKGELGGHIRELAIGLLQEPDYYLADCLRDAMKGVGTREGVLTEILTTRTCSEIQRIRAVYRDSFQRDLLKDIHSDTSGSYRTVLESCVEVSRELLSSDTMKSAETGGLSQIVNNDMARAEAQELFDAIQTRQPTTEQLLIRLLCNRHAYQMWCTIDEYQKIAGHGIVAAIKKSTSGDLRRALKAIAISVLNRPLYFAVKLYKTMKGAGTNDSALIRMIVSRSEIDLDDIKKEFLKHYEKPLAEMIKSDTSGGYRTLLLAIVGE